MHRLGVRLSGCEAHTCRDLVLPNSALEKELPYYYESIGIEAEAGATAGAAAEEESLPVYSSWCET